MRQMKGVKISCIASSILPPGTTMVLARDMNELWIMLSRYARATTVFTLDMSTWAVAYLRPFQVVDIAKVGDAERKMLLAEYTLVARSPFANTKATGMS